MSFWEAFKWKPIHPVANRVKGIGILWQFFHIIISQSVFNFLSSISLTFDLHGLVCSFNLMMLKEN